MYYVSLAKLELCFPEFPSLHRFGLACVPRDILHKIDLEDGSEADATFLSSELGARHQVPLYLMCFVADLMSHLDDPESQTGLQLL